jgi:phenylacetate-CoA ligase
VKAIMGFFPLRSLPGIVWPALPDGSLAQVWAGYQELDRTQWLEPAELEGGQLSQVRTLLAHSAAQVPYYRKLFAEAGIVPAAIRTLDDFRRIPLLTRRLCQDHFDARCAASLPPGTLPRSVLSTSGSTGMPVKVPQTNLNNLWWYAFYLRDLEWCGLRPSDSLAVIRNTKVSGAERQQAREGRRLPSWQRELHPLLDFGPCYGMDIQQDHRRQLHWLRTIQPTYLLSYPTNVAALAALVEEQKQGVPSLRAIHLISESLLPEVQARIEAAFGARVMNTYSCMEAGYVASPCPAGHGLHANAENVLVEVLDEHDRPCAPGQTGRVVLTNLHNFRAPFIRYDIGDEVTLAPGRCPCKRGLPLLTQVHGKVRPLFRLADGRLKRSGSLAEDIARLGGQRQYQVVQKSLELILVRIIPDATWTDGHRERVRRLVNEFFEGTLQVEIQLVEHLPPPPSGKFQSMVCEVPAPGRS